ncbi:MAG: UbiA family prenyltransferase [Saprospiraceae bacterium]|nr:UbiA family prenyltransferase [Saprospiraceae bacterium]
MLLLRKLIDLVLYSNLFIAVCAASLTYQILYIDQDFTWISPYVYLVFFATLFIYSFHRIIGFGKLDRTANNRRINLILKFQNHIVLYGLIGLVGLTISAFQITFNSFLWLAIPGILAIIYVLPIFGRKRRFRDLPFIKVFAIGLVWAWVCVFIPLLHHNHQLHLPHYLLIIEKLFFIIGITLSFDIRDLKLDQSHQIKTIPVYIGVQRRKILALFLLVLAWMLTYLNYQINYLTLNEWIALTLSYLFITVVVWRASENSHDYYFSGLVDGTILLQFILVMLFS